MFRDFVVKTIFNAAFNLLLSHCQETESSYKINSEGLFEQFYSEHGRNKLLRICKICDCILIGCVPLEYLPH